MIMYVQQKVRAEKKQFIQNIEIFQMKYIKRTMINYINKRMNINKMIQSHDSSQQMLKQDDIPDFF